VHFRLSAFLHSPCPRRSSPPPRRDTPTRTPTRTRRAARRTSAYRMCGILRSVALPQLKPFLPQVCAWHLPHALC